MEKFYNIQLLNHKNKDVAAQIYSVFQKSYLKESDLIGVKDFPPLRRTIKDIMVSSSSFWGQKALDEIIGVIEVEQESKLLNISSLAIIPMEFHKGIGASLVNYILFNLSWENAEVQTATANTPAISLYQKAGFSEKERWLSKEGIELILLSKCKVAL